MRGAGTDFPVSQTNHSHLIPRSAQNSTFAAPHPNAHSPGGASKEGTTRSAPSPPNPRRILGFHPGGEQGWIGLGPQLHLQGGRAAPMGVAAAGPDQPTNGFPRSQNRTTGHPSTPFRRPNLLEPAGMSTTGIWQFAVCHLFVVCWTTTKSLCVVRSHKADGKESADSKKSICRPLLLCCQPADGKELEGRRQRARWAPRGTAWLGQVLCRPPADGKEETWANPKRPPSLPSADNQQV